MRDRARVVIVGGGVGGASIAYHLAERGERDVAHGACRADEWQHVPLRRVGGQLRSTLPVTRMMMHSVDLYRRLEADAATTGRSPGWREVGSLRIASTPARMEELRRQHGWATTFGLPLELLGPTDCKALFPPMVLDGVLGGVYLPTDGHLDLSGLTLAPRWRGTGRGRRGRQACAPKTSSSLAGAARASSRTTVRSRPNRSSSPAACTRLSSRSVPGSTSPSYRWPISTSSLRRSRASATSPQLRDPDNLVYFRRRALDCVWAATSGNLPRGPSTACRATSTDGCCPRTGIGSRHSWPTPAPGCPPWRGSIRHLVNGPEGFTPDNEFILRNGARGLFVAAGFCAHGIAGVGGVGQVMAEWVLDGRPGLDVWRMDIRRFGPHYASRDLAVVGAVEVYSTYYYDIHYPGEERRSGRPLRRSASLRAPRCIGLRIR